MPTVAIETHGCKLNQADSQALARHFTQAGYRVVDSNHPADVYVLNTCTVTHVADRKARHALRAARRLNPTALIVATGCYVQRAPKELATLQEVDLALGNTAKSALVENVTILHKETLTPRAVGDEGKARNRPLRTRAVVKIQEGCDQVCSYCIVPRVRGRERSIPVNQLIDQVHRLETEGFQEVVLTGTQLGSYGFDMPGASLEGLLESILKETTIPRLRVSSLQPQEIRPELLRLWENPRLCPHFHMPLQSGSNTVLQRMRRRYTVELYARTVGAIRSQVPGASITADVLVGFPGESDVEFQETYSFCREMRFSAMHVFPYSVRPGTSAAYFKEKVDPHTKSRRVSLLLELAQEHAQNFRRSTLGQIRPVLWERGRKSSNGWLWPGLTDNYLRLVTKSSLSLGNTITPTRLVEERDGVLYGQVCY